MHKQWVDRKLKCWLPGYLGQREKMGEGPGTNGHKSQWAEGNALK